MPLRSEILRDPDTVAALASEWGALWQASTRPLTLHAAWIEAWRRTLGSDGEPLVVVVRRDDALVGVAPFYLRPPRGGALRVRELALMGDGIVASSGMALARVGEEDAVLDAVLDALVADRGWDLLELTLAGQRTVDRIVAGLGERGRKVERADVRGRGALEPPVTPLATVTPPAMPLETVTATSSQSAGAVLCPAERLVERASAVAELAARGPVTSGRRAGESGFVAFLERALPSLAAAGLAELWLVEEGGRLAAGDLVVVDGDRRVELVRATAPGWAPAGEAVRIAMMAHALGAGARSVELLDERDADREPLGDDIVRASRLRVFGSTTAGILQAGYASIERRAAPIAGAALGEFDRLADRATEIVERAVARVASFSKLHLYRGELFVRNAPPPPGVSLRLFTLADYEALPDRAAFLRRLDLEETYCRQKWERGDLVVLAELVDDRGEARTEPPATVAAPTPAGIVWCARFAVHVPEIGREVRPLAGECYIHDVYVAPSARGRAVAPAMLEFLARELRRRDLYRAWALIERSNTPSTRAFEKASYASVADVIYARMGGATKLLVRPPDPEARAFLGLPLKSK